MRADLRDILTRFGSRVVMFGVVVNGCLYAASMATALIDFTKTNVLIRAAIILSSFVLSTALGYWQVYSPYLARRKVHRDSLMDLAVEYFLMKYESISGQSKSIRVNVMPARKAHRVVGRKQLAMAYWFGEYDDTEINAVYDSGVGNCGFAFETNEPRLFDRQESMGNLDLFRLTPSQEKATDAVESLFSVPIYRPDDDDRLHPIGIINIDSDCGTEKSGLDDPQIQNEVIKLATFTGIVFS